MLCVCSGGLDLVSVGPAETPSSAPRGHPSSGDRQRPGQDPQLGRGEFYWCLTRALLGWTVILRQW